MNPPVKHLLATYPQVVSDQAVEKVDIVLEQRDQVEKLVDGSGLQTQLSQTSCLLCLVALGTGRGEPVGAQVLADIGWVGGVIVGISIERPLVHV